MPVASSVTLILVACPALSPARLPRCLAHPSLSVHVSIRPSCGPADIPVVAHSLVALLPCPPRIFVMLVFVVATLVCTEPCSAIEPVGLGELAGAPSEAVLQLPVAIRLESSCCIPPRELIYRCRVARYSCDPTCPRRCPIAFAPVLPPIADPSADFLAR